MSDRLPPLLSVADLPLAELRAATMDGQLVALDEGFLPVDLPDSAEARAAAVALLMTHPGMVAEQESAAWIHGALPNPPSVHRFCVSLQARIRITPHSRRHVREVVLDPGDVVAVAGVRVVSASRTALDLLRLPSVFGGTDVRTVRALLAAAGLEPEDLREIASGIRRLPHRQRALARLRQL